MVHFPHMNCDVATLIIPIWPVHGGPNNLYYFYIKLDPLLNVPRIRSDDFISIQNGFLIVFIQHEDTTIDH